MPTPVQRAMIAGRRAVKSLDLRHGALTRGGVVGPVSFTIGETISDDFVNDGTVVRVRSRDFLIDVDKYVVNAEAVVPRAGDLITYVGEVWEVLPTSSEPEYRRHDRDGLTWRVHTKRSSISG